MAIVTRKGNVKRIRRVNWRKLEFHHEVNEIVTMLKLDIEKGIERGRDLNNDPFKELEPSTIAYKRRKRYKKPTKPLWAEGIMKITHIAKRATKHDQSASIKVDDERIEIGLKHNLGRGVKKRKWFGIGKRGYRKIKKYLRLALSEKLRLNKKAIRVRTQ